MNKPQGWLTYSSALLFRDSVPQLDSAAGQPVNSGDLSDDLRDTI
jgi:hypothetical protein